MWKREARLAGLGLALLLAACGGAAGPSSPDFSLSLSSLSLAVLKGASGSITVTVARTGGFAADVSLTLAGAPSGVTGTFSPNPVGGSVTSAALALNVASSAAAGSSTLSVQGVSGSLTRTANLSLTVTEATVGHITYSLGTKVYLVEARQNAVPQDISAALGATAYGRDLALNISPDGAWLALATGHFDPACANPCLAIAPTADLSKAALVRVGGNLINPELAAIASGGSRIVYSAGGGAHGRDLWVLNLSGTTWTGPVQLTASLSSAKYAWLDYPAISSDGLKVLFDCGLQPYAGPGTAICEIGTDGTGFREVINPANAPAGIQTKVEVHSADYAPDGSLVFEADWDGERVWRLPAGGGTPVQIGSFPNDNSPCALPDGRIVSLWLQRPGNAASVHEIKVMSPDGASYVMALTGSDVSDIGIGCGQ